MSILATRELSGLRRTGHCAATGRAFAAGETYTAALVESDSGTGSVARRVDLSAEAWDKGVRPGDIEPKPDRVLAVWRTAWRPEPKQDRRGVISDDELLELFEQGGELADVAPGGDEKARGVFRYVLALLLVRRRLLRYEGQREGAIVVRPIKPADAPAVRVPEAAMGEEELGSAMEMIGALMTPAEGTHA